MKKGLRSRLAQYGDEEFALFLRRGFLKGAGFTDEALDKPIPENLKTAMATCVSCHGVNFSKPTDGTIPRLAGQYPDYLAIALKSYKVDGNPHYGRANAVMGAMAKPLKDETIVEIADYLASLPGELRTVPQPKFK